MAHKKGMGSSRNGRDSNAQRLGLKKFGGEHVLGGNILARQRGTKWNLSQKQSLIDSLLSGYQVPLFPAPWTCEHKFWPTVARIDNVDGDRNLFCACRPMEDFAE